jgi:glycosyltransferase involved in cell wall biosynthesis
MIRVLLIAPSLDILGGQAVQATRLLALLNCDEVQVSFQPINPPFPKGLRWVKKIPFVRTALNTVLYWTQLFSRAWRPDILHIFSAGLHSYTLWTIPALLAGRLYGKKIIVNYRDGQAEDHLARHRTARPTLRWADRIVTPSDFLVDVFARHGIAAQSIFNIIDPGKFLDRPRSRLRPLLLTNRILEPLYNVPCILRAFARVQARYPEATLTIAHDGPCRPGLEQRAQELGLRQVQFLGRVPHPKIRELYNEADIYLTTPNIDCMPGSLLECMASGLPIVATRAGGIPYIVSDRKTALLVDLDDDQAVAERCFELLENAALVEQLTDAGRKEVLRYESGPVREQWLALYRELA